MEQLKDKAMLEKAMQEGQNILYFTAEWCRDCRYIEPSMPEIAAEFPEWTMIKIDADQWMDEMLELEVRGIPSFVAFKDGKEVGRFSNRNRKTKEQIVEFISQL